jgi:hypothetical protein
MPWACVAVSTMAADRTLMLIINKTTDMEKEIWITKVKIMSYL